MDMDESRFPYGYVPEHLKEKVRNWRSLSPGERFDLTCELSEAPRAKLGVVRDPGKPMDKAIRRVERPGGIDGITVPQEILDLQGQKSGYPRSRF